LADLMGRELGWDADRRDREFTVFFESLAGPARPPASS